ncbi:MAG TPA: hypothetical protein VHP38_01470, partial [Ruminiclostridium sp.]|nr:hypothetical protein [Ruminiclostridium sp.]
MFKQLKTFISGVIVTLGAIALCGTACGFVNSENGFHNNINNFINENGIRNNHVDGNAEEPFIFSGITYVPIGQVPEALNKVVDRDRESDLKSYWDKFVTVPYDYTGKSLYWRYIDHETTSKVDSLIRKYGTNALFQGLKSKNAYSQYYCINRLVEYYNDNGI